MKTLFLQDGSYFKVYNSSLFLRTSAFTIRNAKNK